MKQRATQHRVHRKPVVPKASTEDVLAGNEHENKAPKKWAEHYKHLIELRDHLSSERRTLKADAGGEKSQFSMHMADAGTDSFDQDLALGMLSSEQNALYEIEQALARIRDGTYGICEITGKSIPAERLSAIPWTRFSANAEKQLEKEGVADRARLGEREGLPRTNTQSQVGEEQG